MNNMVVGNTLQNLSEEEFFSVNGGIAVEIAVALIAAAVTIVGGIVAVDMQSAVEQGKNDAYNDIKNKQNGTNGGVILL